MRRFLGRPSRPALPAAAAATSSAWPALAPEEVFRHRRSTLAGAAGAASWCNLTFALIALVLTLTTIGVAAVYSSSAAIVAYRENLSAQRLQRQQADAATPLALALDQPNVLDFFVGDESPSYHSTTFLKKQVAWTLLGLAAMLLFARIDYHLWRRVAPHLLAGSFCLLLCVWAPGIGRTINGAARWIALGPIGMQPSELAKLAMVLFMARYLSAQRTQLRHFLRGFVPPVLILGVVAVVILKEPDLGATVVLGLIVFVMLYAAGARISHLLLLASLAAPVVLIEFAVPYRRARLLAFLNPEEYAQTFGWQLNQSLIAIASGGVWGHGLGAGPQKYQFLSTAFSDFIYAIICEETGFIGAVVIAGLFVALAVAGWMAAYRAPDLTGMLTAIGITCLFALSAFIHMFVNTGLMPTKGLTLPFVSAGGSSLFINLMAAGILVNVARQGELYRAGEVLERTRPLTTEEFLEEETSPRLLLRRDGTARDIRFAPDDLPWNPERN